MDDIVVPDIMNDVLLPQGIYPENFVWISQLKVSGRGVQEGGYLADIECFCPDSWLTGSFLMSGMMFYHTKEHTLKISS